MVEDTRKLLRALTNRLTEENCGSTVSTDSQVFKKLKKEVRENEDIIPDYVDFLLSTLKRSTSKRRHSVLSLVDYFFNRSHKFRLRTVERLQELLALVCETDPLHQPLPGPHMEAKELKVYAIRTVKLWHDKFRAGYDKLNYVSDFLRASKALDFDSAAAELLAERVRKEEEERKSAEILQKVVENIRRKFDGAKVDIERCISSVDTALSILVPIFGTNSTDDSACQSSTMGRSNEEGSDSQNAAHGYTSCETISVVLESLAPEVTVTEDNEALIENVRDAKVMLDVYRKNFFTWLRKICGGSGVELLVRDLTAMKNSIEQRLAKIAELKLKPKRRHQKGAESSDSEESDLEDVPEKQLEDFVPPDEVPRHILDRVQQLEKEDHSNEPCCSKSLTQSGSGPRKIPPEMNEDQKSNIPVVSFGLDLKYWGERRTEAPIPRNNADCHRFWRPPDDDDRPAVSERNGCVEEVRVMTWIGEPLRAEKRCNARLPNGKLCPRMDLRKCPIHGLIIDRDDEGFPLKEIVSPEKSSASNKNDEEEEEEYLRDLEAGTGQSFVSKPKKIKNRREETVRQRLEKKLLNPRTIKRVSAALDAARKARLQKKFGDQFAHSLSK
ncbi:hypothetical protein Q1695_003647 [Nippostrongylus brasiliensis]|nr:hypothetical protein Q1695_003647 [Nippostrongylus brasiliensis]